mmetsp:Transcript_6805/g.5955  ORF Transcript_6805/g.5955 Transcript_6805/m.5955 type:complete len:131 (+) Transcript_6805:27-419(+)
MEIYNQEFTQENLAGCLILSKTRSNSLPEVKVQKPKIRWCPKIRKICPFKKHHPSIFIQLIKKERDESSETKPLKSILKKTRYEDKETNASSSASSVSSDLGDISHVSSLDTLKTVVEGISDKNLKGITL